MARRKNKLKRVEADPQKMRAWRAVRAFKALVPQLQNYARAMTGNRQLRVEATAGTSRTDGRTIFLTPPARLGDDVMHERGHCNKRDKNTLRMVCPACDIDDVVDAGLHHELAHILFGTMETPTPAGVASIEGLINEWHPVEACGHAAEIADKHREYVAQTDDSYMLRCNLFDPILGILLNAFEDARVNVSMFDYRPGTRAMLSSHARTLMQAEVEDNPDWVPWHERDTNSQVLIGMFLIASEEFGQVDMLSDKAKEILWSNDMDSALVSVGRAGTVHDTVQVTVDIFRALQEQGIMVLPKCTVTEEETDAEDDGDDDSAPSSDSGCEGDASESPEQADAGDGSPAGSGKGSSDKASSEAGSHPEEHSDAADRSDGEGSLPQPREGDGSSVPPSDGGEGGQEDQPDRSGEGSPGQDRRGDDASSGASDEDGTDGGSREDPPGELEPEGGWDADSDTEGDAPSGEGAGGVADHLPGGGDTDGDEGVEANADSTSDAAPEDDEAEDQEGELDEASREALRATARGMSLHALFEEELPDANRKEFACGESELHPVAEEGGDDDGIAIGGKGSGSSPGWGVANDDGEIEELLIALAQSGFFEEPSIEVNAVEEHTFPSYGIGWSNMNQPWERPDFFRPGEDIIGQVTTVGRLAFDANRRAKNERNLRSGRIDTRALARRAPFDDERMFRTRSVPGKKSYFVVITLDCSGSTNWGAQSYKVARKGNRRIDRIKRFAFAQAEVLNRLGVPFEIWAHTADFMKENDWDSGSKIQLLKIKTVDEGWTPDVQTRLSSVNPWSGNLDGHTLEFMRKRAEISSATDRIIIYYTDGAMPAMNADEEGQILLRETEHCQRNRIHLLAVAIDTNSPEEWGFNTVEVRDDNDIVKVMEQLQRALA